MKKFVLLFSLSILIIVVVVAFFPLSRAEGIYDNIIRLHVIANSDSDEDQELKLAVRDAILEKMGPLVGECKTVDEAYNVINENIEMLTLTARDTVNEHGYSYNVDSLLTNEYYPTKEYEEVTLPAGEYRSLRIVIGEGEGQNWWCVLYPPLCTGAASAKEELVETGFSPDQIKLITESDDGRYSVRFKIVEYCSELKYRIKKRFS